MRHVYKFKPDSSGLVPRICSPLIPAEAVTDARDKPEHDERRVMWPNVGRQLGLRLNHRYRDHMEDVSGIAAA